MTAGELPGDELCPYTERPVIPRSVRSRHRETKPIRILAVHFGRAGDRLPPDVAPGEPIGFLARAGEILAGRQLVERLAERADGFTWAVAALDAGALWDYLAAHGPAFGDYRAHGHVHESHRPLRTGGMSRSRDVRATFARFGWQRRSRGLVLAPEGFSNLSPWETIGLRPDDRLDWMMVVGRLAIWAADLIGWCQSAGVELRASRGGIAAQLLTDERFWPGRRRKVPRRINALVRDELPGNHYRQLAGGAHELHDKAAELDQRAAHHQAAARATFPHPDRLHGYGQIRDPYGDRAWIRPTDRRWSEIAGMHGIVWARLRVDAEAAARRLALPAVEGRPGEITAAIWTTELAAVEAEPGVELLYLVAGVVARETCDALPTFARWALGQLDQATPARARWLKPVLLAVYGTVAQSPRPMEAFHATPTPHGTRDAVVLAGRIVEAYVSRSRRTVEPGYVDVIARGIVEAETRAETIRMARAIDELQSEHERTLLLGVYADAVILDMTDAERETYTKLAEIRDAAPAAWREKELTQLVMLSPTSYTSDQVDKLPGVPRYGREPK